MNRTLILALLLVTFLADQAQSKKYRVLSIPVTRNNQPVRDAWLGGFDSPQFSSCDLNQDGIPDLFVFDRVGNKVYTYLGNGGSTDTMFTYAPQYESLFPAELNNWALLRDYNHDGFPDIFTHTNQGIRVYKGSLVNGLLHFDMVSGYLKYFSNPFKTNIYTQIGDMPAITDINGDGDLDILTYGFGGSVITYYENQTAEHPTDPAYAADSLPYILITDCWGKAEQSSQTNSMLLNMDTSTCTYYSGLTGPRTGNGDQRHSGNSLYTLHDPVYNAVDILNGNVGYNDLFFLRNNGGHGLNGYFYEWDSIFPPCGHSMLMASYPAAYGVHISGGPQEDILMSPNGYAPFYGATYAARNVKNVIYYKSTGDTTCWYDYQSDSFLVHHMLDFGTSSKPVFYDYNGDGLMDIIVGNYGYFDSLATPQYTGSLAYYQNTGTASHPSFTEITTNLGNFSSYNLRGISPAFGDLNGDGKPDMLVADALGRLYYFQNTATTGSSYPTMTSSNYFNINAGQFSAPFIYDLNGDSLLDLVIGNINGTISYYWNFGTKQNPQFSPDSVNAHLGNVNVTPYGNGVSSGFSQPCIHKDPNGNLVLLAGSQNGTVYKYNINTSMLRSATDTFPLIDSNYLGASVGENATISVADINNDGDLEYLMGTATGGIMMYSDSIWDPGTLLSTTDIPRIKGQLFIYPNPANNHFFCSFENTDFVNPKTEVYNLLGQQIITETRLTGGKIEVNCTSLNVGLYLVKITDSGRIYTGKVLLTR